MGVIVFPKLLTSHTGDLEVSIPASAWVEIKNYALSAAKFASNGPDCCRFQRIPAPRLPRCLTLRRI